MMDSANGAETKPSSSDDSNMPSTAKLEASKRGSSLVVSQESVGGSGDGGPLEKRIKSGPAHQGTVVTSPDAATPSTTASATHSELDCDQQHPDKSGEDDTPPTGVDNDEPPLSSKELRKVPPKSPIGTIQGVPTHSESVCSDLSSASGATAETSYPFQYEGKDEGSEHVAAAESEHELSERSLSPNPRFRVPPAPPSTPASLRSSLGLSFSFDGITDFVGPPTLTSNVSTPIPPLLTGGGTYVRSADLLEQQLLLEQQQIHLLDGGMTPLPPPTAAATYRASNTSTTDASATAAAMVATPKPTSTAAAEAATPKPGSGAAPSVPLPDDFSDWSVGSRYELVRILGRGSYGEVAQAIDRVKTAANANGEVAYVAIKRIQSPFDQQLDAVRLYREIHILRRMREGGETPSPSNPRHPHESRHHECIIQLLDVVQPRALDDFVDLYLVFEYVDTDLYKLIMSPQYLTTEHIQTFLYQILCAIKYIHSFNVFHRDLKPANILLNEDCSLKICDFGLARIVGSDAMSNKDSDPTKATVVDRVDVARGARQRGMPPMPKTNLTRQLTKHVVTRWYRAPELILIQPYTSSVDIWSVGCIFAELLSMQEGNVPGYQDRKPLFPGGTCYPLSGEGDTVKADERLDQLNVIFSVIGTPCDEDIEAIGKANEYISALPKSKGTPLETLYPAADPAAIDLLKKMLYFNPKRRVTAAEALEHDFFKGVRRKDLERTADGPLEGPDFLEAETIDLQLLKQRTYEEVLWYRDHSDIELKPHDNGSSNGND